MHARPQMLQIAAPADRTPHSQQRDTKDHVQVLVDKLEMGQKFQSCVHVVYTTCCSSTHCVQ